MRDYAVWLGLNAVFGKFAGDKENSRMNPLKIKCPVQASPPVRGEDAEKLLESLEVTASPEEMDRRKQDARTFAADLMRPKTPPFEEPETPLEAIALDALADLMGAFAKAIEATGNAGQIERCAALNATADRLIGLLGAGPFPVERKPYAKPELRTLSRAEAEALLR